LKVNFTTDILEEWHGVEPQPWDRVRFESGGDGFSLSGEEWYMNDGGTNPWNETVYHPSDRWYYFQAIVNPTTRTAELWVYGEGHTGDQSPPLSSLPGKEWYRVSQAALPDDMSLNQMIIAPLLLNSPAIDNDETTTIRWSGVQIGDPISTQQAPPAVPEPMTMLAFGSAVAGLGGYIRRRRRA
jgi:hypothetical protein